MNHGKFIEDVFTEAMTDTNTALVTRIERALRTDVTEPTPFPDIEEMLRDTLVALEAAAKREAKLREALEEIEQGRGEFNQDPLTHASNTIKNLTSIARQALKGTAP